MAATEKPIVLFGQRGENPPEFLGIFSTGTKSWRAIVDCLEVCNGNIDLDESDFHAYYKYVKVNCTGRILIKTETDVYSITSIKGVFNRRVIPDWNQDNESATAIISAS